jgi:imidazolonepropionase-like amidohydrolase
MGYFEHQEMAMMVQAGLTPMQVIVSWSKNAAESFGLKNSGTLTTGHYADFIVLEADPLQDIKNMRQISAVYINGAKIQR